MKITDRHNRFYGRFRCDVCHKLIPKHSEGRLFKDSIRGDTLDVCGAACAEQEFVKRYQSSFVFVSTQTIEDSPYGNTGVLFDSED